MDDTGFQTVPKQLPKHVPPPDKREVAKSVSDEQGQRVSVVCAMNVEDHFIPPFFIFAIKRTNLQLIKSGDVGCDMAVTYKGYMNTTTFVKWLEYFAKWSKPSQENPILLILDNYISHDIDFSKRNNIEMLSLPPYTSHKTKLLDRGFFRPLSSL